MQEWQCLIGGEWKKGASVAEVADPYSGTIIASVQQAGSGEYEHAVAAARRAVPVMRELAGYERASILRMAAAGLVTYKDSFAQMIMAEAGKPIAAARSEVDRAVSTFSVAAEEATRMNGEVLPLDITPAGKGKRGIVERFPLGIIGCITPFNFPLNLVAHKIAPAIAAGNAFILKPAPQTPVTALMLGELLIAAGLPAEAVNILPMSNRDAEQLVRDERIAMLSFTGSASVGWHLRSIAGRKKTVLELGGNASVIVHHDADLRSTAQRCAAGAFAYAGQVCIKVQRILVHRSIAEAFGAALTEATQAIPVGDPSDVRTVTGPMISDREAQRVEQWVKEAVDAGARIVTGGTRNGRMFTPTVLTDVTPLMKVCSEELFGPVVTLEPYSDWDEAFAMVNASRYGLQAGIFTNDHGAIQNAYRTLQVGGLIVNDYPTFRVDNMPYGGVKDSGSGREGVRYAMEEMTEPKLLVL